jgi:hypothetical protein
LSNLVVAGFEARTNDYMKKPFSVGRYYSKRFGETTVSSMPVVWMFL